VAHAGFEKLHEILDAEQMETAVHAVQARLAPRYPMFLKSIGHGALGLRRPFYIHRAVMVRFFAPYAVEAQHAERFAQRRNIGMLSGHPPHQDYWFYTPLNALNVWMAIGRVEVENGLSVFSDAWGAALEPDGARVQPTQYLGEPVTLACEAGDLALFHSRHVHASAINLTSSTRCVVTGRLCAERPVDVLPRDLGESCLYSPLIGTRFERFAMAATKASSIYLLEHLKRYAGEAAAALERRLAGTPVRWAARATRRVCRYRRGDVRLYVPPAIRRSIATPARPGDVAEGQIAALDADTCIARVAGRLHAFERRCPHQGADLALGYVREGRVYCPWHNYWFDPASGRGPCAAIRALRTYSPAALTD
jgi:nitrite reductase/ring-hydroxylating ferredoxin subunit